MSGSTQPEFVDFYLPFGGELSAQNRWVKLAGLVPWDLVEERYSGSLCKSGMGAPPLSGRVAFGALIIKERLGVTDEETVEQIRENPYLQFFLGYHELLKGAPFDPSMMVHFRSRFGQEDYDEINTALIRDATGGEDETEQQNQEDQAEEDDAHGAGDEEAGDDGKEAIKSGKLLIDATVTPADITYPTDLKLLNATREKLEHMIDILHHPLIGTCRKPRTYRRKARRDYLAIIKKKRPGAKKIRKAIGRQLRYVRRDLGHIARMLEGGADLGRLKSYDYRCLLVAHEIHRQQEEMWREKKHRIDDRIVSLSQPWVRPIVRGKASAKVEFGAKISVGVSGGYATLHRMSWDAYNECGDLVGQVESYRELHGHYPESVHADQIYRTRANRAWCKQQGIRLSGPPLGRPRRETAENAAELEAARDRARQDEIDRIPVEGKFGNAKRGGTLARVMAKLRHTSVSVVNIGLIVLNLDTRLRRLLLCLLGWCARACNRPMAVCDPFGILGKLLRQAGLRKLQFTVEPAR
jgi:IS5 family transposase